MLKNVKQKKWPKPVLTDINPTSGCELTRNYSPWFSRRPPATSAGKYEFSKLHGVQQKSAISVYDP